MRPRVKFEAISLLKKIFFKYVVLLVFISSTYLNESDLANRKHINVVNLIAGMVSVSKSNGEFK